MNAMLQNFLTVCNEANAKQSDDMKAVINDWGNKIQVSLNNLEVNLKKSLAEHDYILQAKITEAFDKTKSNVQFVTGAATASDQSPSKKVNVKPTKVATNVRAYFIGSYKDEKMNYLNEIVNTHNKTSINKIKVDDILAEVYSNESYKKTKEADKIKKEATLVWDTKVKDNKVLKGSFKSMYDKADDAYQKNKTSADVQVLTEEDYDQVNEDMSNLMVSNSK